MVVKAASNLKCSRCNAPIMQGSSYEQFFAETLCKTCAKNTGRYLFKGALVALKAYGHNPARLARIERVGGPVEVDGKTEILLDVTTVTQDGKIDSFTTDTRFVLGNV